MPVSYISSEHCVAVVPQFPTYAGRTFADFALEIVCRELFHLEFVRWFETQHDWQDTIVNNQAIVDDF